MTPNIKQTVLTDAEILQLFGHEQRDPYALTKFARAIESAVLEKLRLPTIRNSLMVGTAPTGIVADEHC
ncbi:hypothetical protein vBBaMIFTN2_37 [Bordetella phage vB_BaM-IFTN2]|uniref:hypothetical protein n=2 Tax=Bordetella avium TaxID=521 RepID=UPI000E0B2675|nr:hypothetical protein [Bordetella avium]UOK17103.1 hypothetical protein vBBaMIFTN2_37 [Bordetella phage vB_BaM-IFTN2]UOK17300.1 hypothetical protein vBBaMIFTN5_36 [Bordetella phage vB_BaM-IFTN5]RIQ50825.1 hypothetical protein D0844_14935 [Bordetella avium]RIQ58508.1 hypothetical protein D0840_17105 [Bordetella avium]WQE34237.1 hypothetical protein U0029_03410 [Bordetella avium]